MRGVRSHPHYNKGTFVPLDIPGDTPLTSDEEPWRTARDIIADQGFNAEVYVIRLAARFADEGNVEDAATLGEVLDAITVLRGLKGIHPPKVRH